MSACHADAGPAVGVSSPHAETSAPSAKPVDAAVEAPSPVAADFREHLARLTDRAVSRGHAERFDGVLWANDVGRAAWDAPGNAPDGALLVEETIERTGKGDRAAGLLVMEKQSGAWRFVVVDAGGHVVAWAREQACVGCHREAPRDFVFHLDTAAAPAASASK
ncbi:MAG: hypothetical protein ABSE49_08975 [Polyangiaceae bacterium]